MIKHGFCDHVIFSGHCQNVCSPSSKGRTGGGKEEKGLLDWILGGLQMEDQLLETDPLLKKVEEESGGTTTRGGQQKNGGFGELFAKK
ncbi:hypothetical protein K1719_011267 [Acacia pycnantha]|nr:hypothetical protein K1719_011267 [Acacia pycnantha]